jgi:virulence factor Mce-like protein
MRSRWNLPIVVAYAVAVAVVGSYLGVRMGGEFLFQPTYRVAAEFGVGTQLVVGDDVTISGLRVGRVEGLEPVAAGARVELLIHRQYAPLYRDARAMVKTKNLLGEAYVELSRGSGGAGPIAEGGTIGRERTLTPVEVDQVLSVLDRDTRQQLVALIDGLGESVDGRGGDLNAATGSLRVVAQALETVAGSLAGQNGHLDSLLTSLTKVLDTLAAWHTELRQLIGDWDGVMRTLAARERDLQGVIVDEDQVVGVIDEALSRNTPEGRVQDYDAVLAGLNARRGDTHGLPLSADQLQALVDQPLAPDATVGLHQALARSPRLVDAANHYLVNGDLVFGRVTGVTTPITDLFYELASVMSGVDSQGNHYWRVYPVNGGLGPG